mgnify:CR=1 FL=1
MTSLPSIPLPAILALLSLAALARPAALLADDEDPLLRIAFEERSTVLSGRVASEADAGRLVEAVRTARPDLAPDRSGLAVDPSVSLPDIGDLLGVLSELALSTHGGKLELWPGRLVLGGLTDSLVVGGALRIRAEPLLRDWKLHNEILVVDTDDLPRIDVVLSGGRMAADGATAPSPPTGRPFEAPGLRLDKLLATVRFLDDLGRLGLVPSSPAVPGPPRPAQAETPPPPSMSAAAPPSPAALPPTETFEALPSVRFSRSSFLLQANQTETLDALAQHLLSPSRRGALVRIEAVKPGGGSSAFNDYLCERRAAEVARLLSERGVESSLFAVKSVDSPSPIDEGEVRLLVEIPPPPAPEDAAPANPADAVDAPPATPAIP